MPEQLITARAGIDDSGVIDGVTDSWQHLYNAEESFPSTLPPSDNRSLPGSEPDVIPWAAKSTKTTDAAHQTNLATTFHVANVLSTKLSTYDNSTCLETFLAGIKNIVAYFR